MGNKGFFITFEGGDGAGKTTLLEGVYAHFQNKGVPLLKTRAPGGTELGKEIRSLLLEKRGQPMAKLSELFLFLADRTEHVEKEILPALQEGKLILCDRFTDSTIAYQAGARGLKEAWVRSLCEEAALHVHPHLTFYLDIPPEVGLKRAKAARGTTDRIEEETLSFHEKIRRCFLELAKRDKKRMLVLDATQPKETLLKTALEEIINRSDQSF